jgi:acid phosphatase family membrane protein YuiD
MDKLREKLGHSMVEILSGIAIGVLSAILIVGYMDLPEDYKKDSRNF